MNIAKQIEYWQDSSEEDIETAHILIEKKRFLHGLFFCHLAVEKALKALFVGIKKELAPKTHNLIYLSTQCDLNLSDEQQEFLAILMKYQISGRYPDSHGHQLDYATAILYYN